MTKTKLQQLEERRQAIRARRILSIQFRLVKSRSKKTLHDTPWHLSTTYDMSAVGLAFLSDAPYQLGDVLELNIVISGVIDVYKGLGQVVRVAEKSAATFLVAVKFVDEPTQ